MFTKRRGEFEFAMAISTTSGVHTANLKLDVVDERTAELSRRCVSFLWQPRHQALTTCIRMDTMLQLFQEFVTPQQKKLAAMADAMGRDVALENEQAMKELAGAESSLDAQSGQESQQDPQPFNFTELRQEIDTDPDEAIKMNAEFFNHKFDIQRRQIKEDIDRALKREGDRIISLVTAGPHDRIADPVSAGFPAFE